MTVTEVGRRPTMAYAAALVLVAAVAGLLLWRSSGHDAAPGPTTARTAAALRRGVLSRPGHGAAEAVGRTTMSSVSTNLRPSALR